jgi:hypothetical protein
LIEKLWGKFRVPSKTRYPRSYFKKNPGQKNSTECKKFRKKLETLAQPNLMLQKNIYDILNKKISLN